MAKLNKPVFTAVSGPAFNSSIAFAAAGGIPLFSPSALFAFNDCQFGFVPHGGQTYHLSRMPGNTGKFAALTGLKLKASDAKDWGLGDHITYAG